MSTLVVPDPTLVVLIGAAGSGKSTLAARLFAPGEVVSSDALRAAISGNEADQRATAPAFRALHRTVDRRLAAGALTVVDATNAKRNDRRPLIHRARATGTPVVAIVLDLPPSTIHAQNAARPTRVVDPTVVDRHLEAIRDDIDQGRLTTEGFDHIVMLRSSTEVDDLRIDRRSSVNQPT